MLFSLREILDIVIATIVTGYIFMDYPRAYTRLRYETFGNRLLFSIAITAPALILHELAHKFTAMAYGFYSTVHAFYQMLGLGLVLKLINFPFVLLIPAYASFSAPDGFHLAVIAFAGPALNLILFFVAWLLLRFGRWSETTTMVLGYTKVLNLLFFAFNMLPIPGVDGWAVYTNLF